jgi:hypothetical protein
MILKSFYINEIPDLFFTINKEKEKLHESGWEMLHNETIYSSIYGQLSIFEGLPYYFDGKTVVFNGFRLTHSNLDISKILKRFSYEFMNTHQNDFETLNYWGTEEPMDLIHPDLICTEKVRPNNNNRDIVLKLNELKLDDIYELRFVRKAIRLGLSCKINIDKSIGDGHFELVDLFFKRHSDIDDDGKKYIESWKNVLMKPDSLLFEVYKDEKLSGMLILSLFFKSMPTYAYGLYNNEVTGTSDLAYAAMIEYCKLLDFPLLDLGYSVKESLLKYKLKWGPVTFREAPWSITWRKS